MNAIRFDVFFNPYGLSHGEREFIREHSDRRVSVDGNFHGESLIVRALEDDGITLLGISAATSPYHQNKQSITVVHRSNRSIGIGRTMLKMKAAAYKMSYLRDLEATVHPTNGASIAMCREAGVRVLLSEVPHGTDQARDDR